MQKNIKGKEKEKKRFSIDWVNAKGLIQKGKFPVKKWQSSWSRLMPKVKKKPTCDKTVLQLLAQQMPRVADRIALIGISQRPGKYIHHLTYRELDKESNRLACFLLDKGTGTGSIVGIMMERSIEMVIALFGVWKAGGAYLFIEPDFPGERIDFMLADSNTKIVIGNEMKKWAHCQWSFINCDLLTGAGPHRGNFHHPSIIAHQVNHLAYVIYTSGSTGRPKGVLVEHRNLVAYLNAFARQFKFTGKDIVLQQASCTFDTFVEEVYGALLAGSAVVIAGKQTVRDIDLLLEFLERHCITVMDCVPLLLNELNKHCAGEPQRRRLRSIHTFISGGDVLKYRHIDNLLKIGKVYNTYGPSETTVCATYYRCPVKKFQTHLAVPIGKPIAGYRVYIKGPKGKPAPTGVSGELCISGTGVARGYLNQPERTWEKFNRGVYQTGDLACRLRGGNIVYLGRMDLQVKIRGIRIELKEIEAHLEAHPDIREVMVTAREDENGDKYLAAYVAPVTPGGSHIDARRLRKYLAAKLPEYMIPSIFVILDRMPLTPAGKLDRWALMALSGSDIEDGGDEAGTEMGSAGKNKAQVLQETLVHIWQKVLKIKRITIHDNFFHLGGHSLRVMRVVSEIRKRLAVPVRGTDIYAKPTIKELADLILNLKPGFDKEDFPPLEAVEKKDYYPATSLQKRFYILDRMANTGIAYNIPDVKVLYGKINPGRLEEICRLLIKRHESFRISFCLLGEEVVLRIHAFEELTFQISYFECVGQVKPQEEISGILRDFVRPFNLHAAPLFRVGFLKLADEKYLFIYDMHHIIADGMSSLIFEHELVRLLEGGGGGGEDELPQLSIQYKDFSQWQKGLIKSGKLKKQEDYWLHQFQGEIPALNLPLDYPAPAVQSFTGDTLNFKFNTGARFDRLLKDTGTTLYMVLLAVYNVLLARYTGQEDIIVGSPTAGRNPVRINGNTGIDLGNIIGLFINVMVLRNFPAGRKRFHDFLAEVKENVLNAFENQEYPYGELIETLALKKDLSKNPLFSVELIVHNMEIPGADAQGKWGGPFKAAEPGLSDFGYDMKISQVDITLVAVEQPGFISCSLIYCTRLFKRDTMERFTRHFIGLVDSFLAAPTVPIADVPLLSAGERKQVLLYANGIELPVCADVPVYRLIEEQAGRRPDKISVIGSASSQLTYGHVNEQSGRLAGLLIEKGFSADGIAGIMMGRSVEMITGLLGIWKAGGAYLPIDVEYPQDRIAYMLKDSGASILVTDYEREKTANGQLPVVNGESLMGGGTGVFQPSAFSPLPSNRLAYIIYTSGSTGRPKGVLVEHVNLAAYITAFNHEFNISAQDIVLQQAAYTFDAFAEEVYPALAAGGRVVIPPRHEVMDTRLLTDFITRHGVNIIDCSPLLLNELNKRLPGEAMHARLPVFTFISGGDVLKKEYIDHLTAIGNVYNTYGPTESTICASYYRCSPGTEALPPIGKPIANYGVYILDKTGGLVPCGVVGQLCITGPGVTRGYLNNPELTCEKFIMPSATSTRNPFEKGFAGSAPPKLLLKNHSPAAIRHSPLYQTGDLGRWLPDGNIAYVGRIDFQVKIRGYRIETAEIESQLVMHPGINESVVVVREDQNGDKHLCAYVVADVLPEGLREFLADRLPHYMIPSFFAAIDKIPLTPLGKIDRHALPSYDAETPGEFIAPGNLLEEKLAEIWAGILDMGKRRLSTNANFFHMGGHSLKAAHLVNEIYRRLNVEISMVEVFKNPTIRDLSQVIRNADRKSITPLAHAEKKEYYGLSPAQKRMYILQQWEPGSPGYNVSDAVGITGQVKPQQIEDLFKKLIRRHESFRTSFHMKDREAIQRIHEEVEFKVEYFNLAADATNEHGQTRTSSPNTPNSFIRTFDLSRAPLLRVGLAEIKSGQYLLLMDMHHIISDGISLYLLGKEFAALYNGEGLPPLKFQYKDYAAWKNQRLELREEEIRNQETYWLKQFEDQVPVLSLPQDYPRPAVKSFKGLRINFSLDNPSVRRFYALAEEKDVTLYILLLAIFNIFIFKLSGSDDIVAGTPVAGRRHPDLRQIIGMFVNTLALRNYPNGEKSFFAFLKEVKTKFLEALENQDYEFEELVEKLGVPRDASRNPLFDVMFTLRSAETQQGNSPHPEIQDMPPSYDYSHRVARFDLILLAVEDAGNLLFTLEYSTELFKEETAERFVGYFKNLASAILETPGRQISQFELITPAEKEKLLHEFNNAPGDYPFDKTIPMLFAEQVAWAGDGIAVAARETRETHETREIYEKHPGPVYITYRALNEQTDGIARVLAERGVIPDTIVAVQMERSPEMIIGILGILKAGGAYLPIESGYPPERIDYMLKDSGASILLTDSEREKGNNGQLFMVNCKLLMKLPTGPFHPSSFSRHHSMQLAYIIYTSGSTGRPKGVLNTHANVIRVVKNTNYIEWHENDRLLQLSNYAFDGSIFDIYGALLNRAVLVLPDKEHISSVPGLADLIKKEQITVFFVTTALFNTLVDGALGAFENVRKVLFGGERVSVEHVEKAFAYMGKGRLLHVYGPTETTVYATYYPVVEKNKWSSTIPIGKPISDTSLYILDKSRNLSPIGIGGELYIGGGGTARGYLNNPELTHEKFKIKNPSPLYRTGDLCRWLPDGNIEYIEREDRQVKIRGFRIEIGEIESKLLKHEAIKEALVIVREKNKDNYLCAYYIVNGVSVSGAEPEAGDLKQYLAESLPAYMVPAYFILLKKFPLTPNGKVDKKQLPVPDIEELAGRYEAPRDEIDEKLVQIWSDVLGVGSDIIGINANFFQLGGHSLKAIVMVDRIQITFHVKILLTDLFQRQSVKELADYIRIKTINREILEPEVIDAAETREYYPLTPEQERMFELHRFYGFGNRIFNMPWAGELGGTGEANLEKIFGQLIERHESLRTSFLLVDGKPAQVVHKKVDFKLECFDLATEGTEVTENKENTEDKENTACTECMHHFIRPFDLSKAPLVRVGAARKKNGKLLLLVDMHHIISDGTSFSILLRELNELIKGNPLSPLRVQYKDYVQWQESGTRKKILARQEAYWLNLLAKPAPELSLPVDFPRPAVRGMAADVIGFELDSQDVKALRALAKKENCSFFMVMLALFNLLLFKLTGREDILVSTFFAGRRSPDLRKMVGMFVKTLLLRNHPLGEKPFTGFLNEVKQQTLNAYENQDYSRERLMKKMAYRREKSLPVDVNFVLQNIDPDEMLMTGFQVLQSAWAVKADEIETRIAFYDLRFEGFQLGEGLIFNVEYDINLFREETVNRFISDFKKIISGVLKAPDKKIADL